MIGHNPSTTITLQQSAWRHGRFCAIEKRAAIMEGDRGSLAEIVNQLTIKFNPTARKNGRSLGALSDTLLIDGYR